jgi:GT2 family glycosyltransferase
MNGVSIIVPTNRKNLPYKCLEDVLKSFILHPCEVIVVTNSIESYKVHRNNKFFQKKLSNRHCLYEEIPGLLASRHRGLNAAKYSILIFLDDDVVFNPNNIQEIFDTFDKDNDIQLVGTRYLPKYECNRPNWLDSMWQEHKLGKFIPSLSLLDFGIEIRELNEDFVWGLCFAVKKESVIKNGGFHPDGYPWKLRFLRGDGESGLSKKIQQSGGKIIYLGNVTTYHNIPPKRMTVKYFKERSYLEGITNSYSDIRSKGLVESRYEKVFRTQNTSEKFCIRSNLRNIRNIFFLKVSFLEKTFLWPKGLRRQSKVEQIRQICWESFLQGYKEHQQFVRNCPHLMSWVLKEDYFDYQLPNLEHIPN